MLNATDKSTHEENLSEPLQTRRKQLENAASFLTSYSDIFIVANKTNKTIFISVFEGPENKIIRITPGIYDLESLNEEIRRFIINEGFIRRGNLPFPIKQSFSTLGSFLEIASSRGCQISFVRKDILRDLLGFKSTVELEEFNLSPNPNDIL